MLLFRTLFSMMKFVFLCRSFSMCNIALGKSFVKQARIMNKFIGESSKKRSWYPAKDISAVSLPQIIQPKRVQRNSRRMSVLNKLFMKYISDLMTTGEVFPETALLGIDISKVKISPDFSILKVYWVAKGNSTDEKVESVLSNYGGPLRHELTQLRVIGNVPNIIFVRDKSMSTVAEVDAVLARADFGDDFVPTDPSYFLLSNLTLSTKLPKHLEEKILSEDGGLPEIPVPSMQSDALGLEHDVIMQKVQLSMNKAKAPHRNQRFAELNSTEETLASSLKDEETVEGVENEISMPNSDLKKFFAKRIALQSKVMKNLKNYEPGKELMLDQESSEDYEDDFDDYDALADAQRIKELGISVDDFVELEEDSKSQLYDDVEGK